MPNNFEEKYSIPCIRGEGGSYSVELPIRFEGLNDEDIVPFIFDTGAFLTVINYDYYIKYKLNSIVRKEISINGYNGETVGYIYTIPGVSIGEYFLSNVWIFTPKKNIVDGKDITPKQNLLGRNVIEHFKYYHDTDEDFFYFKINSNPKHYEDENGFSLKSGEILILK